MLSRKDAPHVIVPKPEHKVRLHGYYKVTLNSSIKTDRRPLPLVEDISAVLVGGKVLTVLD